MDFPIEDMCQSFEQKRKMNDNEVFRKINDMLDALPQLQQPELCTPDHLSILLQYIQPKLLKQETFTGQDVIRFRRQHFVSKDVQKELGIKYYEKFQVLYFASIVYLMSLDPQKYIFNVITTPQDLIKTYPSFDGQSREELQLLLRFRNFMAVAVSLYKQIAPQYNKTLLLKICTSLEGSGKVYDTGSHQRADTTRRVLIYETESGVTKKQRPPRRLKTETVEPSSCSSNSIKAGNGGSILKREKKRQKKVHKPLSTQPLSYSSSVPLQSQSLSGTHIAGAIGVDACYADGDDDDDDFLNSLCIIVPATGIAITHPTAEANSSSSSSSSNINNSSNSSNSNNNNSSNSHSRNHNLKNNSISTSTSTSSSSSSNIMVGRPNDASVAVCDEDEEDEDSPDVVPLFNSQLSTSELYTAVEDRAGYQYKASSTSNSVPIRSSDSNEVSRAATASAATAIVFDNNNGSSSNYKSSSNISSSGNSDSQPSDYPEESLTLLRQPLPTVTDEQYWWEDRDGMHRASVFEPGATLSQQFQESLFDVYSVSDAQPPEMSDL